MSTFVCPICEGRAWHRAHVIDSSMEVVPQGLTRPRRIHVEIGKCDGCGLEFNLDVLGGKDFMALYAEEALYSSGGYGYRQRIEPKYTVDVVNLLDGIASHRERLLEIGFLQPDLMEAFKRLGWTVEGVDLDRQAVAQAATQGYTVHQGSIYDAVFDTKRYAAVVAIAVLEHIEDPNAFVRRIEVLLSPGGFLLLQLPNPGSLNARVSSFSAHGWDMYAEPGHIYHYYKHHLERLFERHGLAVVFYGTATIRVRGKIPVLPGRHARLEAWVSDRFHTDPTFRRVYTGLLRLLDRVELGDTHIVVAQKAG